MYIYLSIIRIHICLHILVLLHICGINAAHLQIKRLALSKYNKKKQKCCASQDPAAGGRPQGCETGIVTYFSSYCHICICVCVSSHCCMCPRTAT